MIRKSMLVPLLLLLGHPARAEAQPTLDTQRGQLLYSTHCVACHSDRIHWRDRKLVKDWQSLRSEVHRWQEVAGLRWSAGDIEAVSQYLNTVYYHYPTPG
jgi:mono/diheme cytochrome c family protein